MPSTSNGGITNGGKTYTFHIKSGVDWNTMPPRQVVAGDFIREFKAFCNPVSPVGNPVYYEATISGLKQYCNAEAAYFANKSHAPTAANIANFQNTHTITGITSPNPMTIQFHLLSPASDFIYMMAMPFTSARPVEYDKYVPNSLQLDQHMISDGPYQITSYIAEPVDHDVRNTAWKQSTDSVRHQYVKQITVTMGVSDARRSSTTCRRASTTCRSSTSIVPSEVPTLEATHNPKFLPGRAATPSRTSSSTCAARTTTARWAT